MAAKKVRYDELVVVACSMHACSEMSVRAHRAPK